MRWCMHVLRREKAAARAAPSRAHPPACPPRTPPHPHRPTHTPRQVFISYLEIYNEVGYDLLDPAREVAALEDMPQVGGRARGRPDACCGAWRRHAGPSVETTFWSPRARRPHWRT